MPTNEKPGPELNIGPWRYLLWMMALFGMLYLFYSQELPTAEPSYTISYSRFKSLVETSKVEKVLLAGDTASGQLFDDTSLGPQGEPASRFTTPYGAKTESLVSGRFTIVEIKHTPKPFAAMNRIIG